MRLSIFFCSIFLFLFIMDTNGFPQNPSLYLSIADHDISVFWIDGQHFSLKSNDHFSLWPGHYPLSFEEGDIQRHLPLVVLHTEDPQHFWVPPTKSILMQVCGDLTDCAYPLQITLFSMEWVKIDGTWIGIEKILLSGHIDDDAPGQLEFAETVQRNSIPMHRLELRTANGDLIEKPVVISDYRRLLSEKLLSITLDREDWGSLSDSEWFAYHYYPDQTKTAQVTKKTLDAQWLDESFAFDLSEFESILIVENLMVGTLPGYLYWFDPSDELDLTIHLEEKIYEGIYPTSYMLAFELLEDGQMGFFSIFASQYWEFEEFEEEEDE